jgi:hypothetical protein
MREGALAGGPEAQPPVSAIATSSEPAVSSRVPRIDASLET